MKCQNREKFLKIWLTKGREGGILIKPSEKRVTAQASRYGKTRKKFQKGIDKLGAW